MPGDFDALFNELKSSALPGVWAKGLSIARNRQVYRDGRNGDPGEVMNRHGSDSSQKYRISVPDRVVKPVVTLWPHEIDYHCDCGDSADPCMHAVSAAIAEKNTWVSEAAEKTQGASSGGETVQYHFETRAEGPRQILLLSRSLGGKEVSGSLVSLLGGVQSGRVLGGMPQVVQADLQVDRIGSSFFRPSGPSEIPVPAMEALFKTLSERSDHCFFEGKPVSISARPLRRRFEVKSRYRLEESPTTKTDSFKSFSNGAIFNAGTLQYRIDLPSRISEEMARRLGRNLSFPEMVDWMNSKDWEGLNQGAEVLDPQALLPELKPIPIKVHFHLEEHSGQVLTVLPRLVYGNPPIAEVRRSGDLDYLTESQAPVRGPEQISEEKTLIRRVQQEFHLSIGQASKWEGVHAVQMKEKLEKQCKTQPGIYSVAGRGQEGFGVAGRLDLKIQTVLQPDGSFRAQTAFQLPDGKSADPHRVFKAWDEKTPLVPLLEGGWAELPVDLLNRMGAEIRRLLLRPKPIPSAGLPALQEILVQTAQPVHPLIRETVESLTNRLKRPESLDHLPVATRELLRPYQSEGIQWLLRMKRLETGVILADDMGLGKTLQALSAIAKTDRVLLVVPTSVLSGWQGQVAKFRPDLKMRPYIGQDRKLPDRSQPGILLTTHGTFRQDQEELNALHDSQPWDVAIFDEAQAIKNPDSQLAIAAHQVRARFRLALSGTPIENRLLDLWSILQFSEPALFGSRSEFLELSQLEPAKIKNRIAPHFLRRLKKEVAQDLPEKIETVLDCELSADERNQYDAVFATTQKKVREALLGNEEDQPNMMLALEALLRLRQVSCDARLVPGLFEPMASAAFVSAKIRVLMDSLSSAIQNGHRCLVFSQWTSFLNLLEPELAKESIRFSRIDGATQDRARIIDEFQKDDGPSVMLLSLKAGGVGLTLTAADQVYLLDPWWNPAAEDQASDRAHRIGQTRSVQVHRLISKDTVEEKILELSRKKREMTETYLSDGSIAAGLSASEILELIRA